MKQCEKCGHEVDYHRPDKLGGLVCRLRISEEEGMCGCQINQS